MSNGPLFRVAHESHASVLSKTTGLCQVDADTIAAGRQVCVDFVDCRAV